MVIFSNDFVIIRLNGILQSLDGLKFKGVPRFVGLRELDDQKGKYALTYEITFYVPRTVERIFMVIAVYSIFAVNYRVAASLNEVICMYINCP